MGSRGFFKRIFNKKNKNDIENIPLPPKSPDNTSKTTSSELSGSEMLSDISESYKRKETDTDANHSEDNPHEIKNKSDVKSDDKKNELTDKDPKSDNSELDTKTDGDAENKTATELDKTDKSSVDNATDTINSISEPERLNKDSLTAIDADSFVPLGEPKIPNPPDSDKAIKDPVVPETNLDIETEIEVPDSLDELDKIDIDRVIEDDSTNDSGKDSDKADDTKFEKTSKELSKNSKGKHGDMISKAPLVDEIMENTGALAQKLEKISRMQKDIEKRNKESLRREKQIELKEKNFTKKARRKVELLNRKADRLKQKIADENKKLKSVNASFKKVKASIAKEERKFKKLFDSMVKKERRIKTQQEKLDKQASELAKKEAAYKVNMEKFDEFSQTYKAQKAELKKLNDELDKSQKELSEREAKLAKKSAKLDEQSKQIDEKSQVLKDKRIEFLTQVNQRENDVKAKLHKLHSVQYTLEKMHKILRMERHALLHDSDSRFQIFKAKITPKLKSRYPQISRSELDDKIKVLWHKFEVK